MLMLAAKLKQVECNIVSVLLDQCHIPFTDSYRTFGVLHAKPHKTARFRLLFASTNIYPLQWPEESVLPTQLL